MQKKLILIVLAVAVIGASVWGYSKYKGAEEPPQIVKGTVTRGDIVETVGATGTLEAVTTVQVGTQVSGTVDALYADFNNIVKKGQVMARLDPSLIDTQIEQQRANLIRAQADLDRLQVGLADAKQKQQRARDLGKRGLIPQTEVEAADVAVLSQEASIRSSRAGLTQAQATLNQQLVNRNHTVITAPIDGIVVSRNVDAGQTVAASMNAPVLFLLAADLTKMKVSANIDEAEVGKIRPGQRVTFRVDAYPGGQPFEGVVTQVRLQPVAVQNVVSYVTVIEAPNPDMRLKPGMTANVNIEIARRDNVLRLPAAATRFRPNAEIFAALGQPVPEDLNQGNRGRGQNAGGQGPQAPTSGPGAGQTATTPAPGGRTGQPATAAPATPNASAAQPNAQRPAPRQGRNAQGQTADTRGGGDATRGGGDNARGGNANRGGDNAGGNRGGDRGGFGNMTPEERAKRMEERMKAMTPEERAAFQARMAQRGQGGGRDGGQGNRNAQGNMAGGRGQGAGQNTQAQRAPGRQGGAGNAASTAPAQRGTFTGGAQTVDALFAPLPVVTTRGRVWMLTGDPKKPQIKSINVRTGVSDGTFVELLEGELTEGQEIVTGIILASARAQVPGNSGGNPLMGPQRGPQPGGQRPGGQQPAGGRGR